MPYGNATVSDIISVADGDTFVCTINDWPDIIGLRIPVRINHIDALELDDTRPLARALAQQAKSYLEHQLKSANLVELHNIRRGKFFRLAATVYVDGVNLGQLMIDRGLALPYEGGKKPAWLNLP